MPNVACQCGRMVLVDEGQRVECPKCGRVLGGAAGRRVKCFWCGEKVDESRARRRGEDLYCPECFSKFGQVVQEPGPPPPTRSTTRRSDSPGPGGARRKVAVVATCGLALLGLAVLLLGPSDETRVARAVETLVASENAGALATAGRHAGLFAEALLARSRRGEKEHREALDLFRKALGRFEELDRGALLEEMRRLVRLHPRDPRALDYLAILLEAGGSEYLEDLQAILADGRGRLLGRLRQLTPAGRAAQALAALWQAAPEDDDELREVLAGRLLEVPRYLLGRPDLAARLAGTVSIAAWTRSLRVDPRRIGLLLELVPRGLRSRLVPVCVGQIEGAKPNEGPVAAKTPAGAPSGTTAWTVENRTREVVHFLVSGKEAVGLRLEGARRARVVLPSGFYRIAVATLSGRLMAATARLRGGSVTYVVGP